MKPLFNNIQSHVWKYRFEWLIFALVPVFFWPMVNGTYIPKWDAIDGYLPYRYMVGEYLSQGHFPLWHPFEHLGTPLYSDLQSGAWNPIVWSLIVLFDGYDIQALIVEFLLCYLIAGIGMFRLSEYLFKNKNIAFILGVSYAFSGFMVGSSHLMVFLLGIAWLPWITYFFLRIIHTLKLKYLVAWALVMALHMTSASPAFTILLVYFHIGVLIYYLWHKRTSNYPYKKLLLQLTGGLLLLLVLTAPYLWAFFDFAPYFNRTDKLELDRFLINPFTTKEYVSFVFPFTTNADTEIFSETDLSLRNGYMGWIGFSGMLISLFYVRKKVTYFLACGIIVSLVFASGAQSGLYEYFVKLPGIGLFRHPSLYKSYTIFFGLILCGMVLDKLIKTKQLKKGLFWWSILSLLFFGFSFFRGFSKSSWGQLWSTWEDVEHPVTNASTHMAMNALIMLSIIVIGILIYFFFKIKPLKILAGLVVVEFFLVTQFLAPTTVYLKTDYKTTKNYFESLPETFDQQWNQTALKELKHNNNMPYIFGFWRNLSTLHKRPAFDGYNPMRFKMYDDVSADERSFSLILENPLMYSPSKKLEKSDTIQPGIIWGTAISEKTLTPSEVKDVTIDYNSFNAKVENGSSSNSWIVLNQNYHDKWTAFLNGKSLKISPVNDVVMGVQIPPQSKGELVFQFQSPAIKWMFFLAVMGYLFTFYILLKPINWRSNTTQTTTLSKSHRE